VYSRTLKRAAEVMGGEEQLAQRLTVAPTQFGLWIRGLVLPPGDVFLKGERGANAASEQLVRASLVPEEPKQT
jgi:DNA-binding transcriptional regulator YdaS (Cro superfamily)